MVGRGGLEPPTSAVIGPERCTSESGRPSVRRGVIRPGKTKTVSDRHPFDAVMIFRLAGIAVVTLICGCGTAQTSTAATPSSVASEPRTASPTTSASPDSAFATYSMNRITFRYPVSWRLVPPPQGGSIIWLYSADYKDDGGVEIQTIRQGSRIDISQTDIPQKDVTADNYATKYPSGAADGTVVVINGRKAFQDRQAMPPWFDATDTVVFRDDGTRVEVRISYPSGQPTSHVQDYDQLLASLVIQ
jgi:hypothetical protein